MSHPKLTVLAVAAGLFLAAESSLAHPISVSILAGFLAFGSPSHSRFAVFCLAIVLIAHALFSLFDIPISPFPALSEALPQATWLHDVVTLACIMTLFLASRHVPQPYVSQRDARPEAACDNVQPVTACLSDPTGQSESTDSHHPSDYDFDASSDVVKRTSSLQKTQFIFPLTSLKSHRIAYNLDPDETLDNVVAQMSTDELLKRIEQAEILSPESLAQLSQACQTAPEIIDALMQSGALTSYQAMLIACGLPELLRIGSYQVIERIGQGGMAIVLRVRDQNTHHTYALKLLVEADAMNDVLRNRFLREMNAVRELAHPNIAVARTVGEHNGMLYIVMEWVKGCNLAQYVHKRGPLSSKTAIRFIRQAAEALQYAHQRGLVHRDVKPANLILGPRGVIKLVDMGLARFVDAIERQADSPSNHWKTDTGHLMGTIDYMAPEQAIDLGLADQRSDIYSLGCTLFYLLTGETHLRGKTQRRRAACLVNKTGMRELTQLRDDLDPCIAALVKKMMQIVPEERYQSTRELLEAIDRCAERFGMPAQNAMTYRVLVVEDSPTQSMITCQQLQATSRHFIPVDVSTLSAACERLRAYPFDLVLLDLNLPDSQGLETIAQVRLASDTVPILILTSTNDLAVGVDCIAAGADDFLPKDSLDVLTLERHILLTMSRRQLTAM